MNTWDDYGRLWTIMCLICWMPWIDINPTWVPRVPVWSAGVRWSDPSLEFRRGPWRGSAHTHRGRDAVGWNIRWLLCQAVLGCLVDYCWLLLIIIDDCLLLLHLGENFFEVCIGTSCRILLRCVSYWDCSSWRSWNSAFCRQYLSLKFISIYIQNYILIMFSWFSHLVSWKRTAGDSALGPKWSPNGPKQLPRGQRMTKYDSLFMEISRFQQPLKHSKVAY